MKLKILFKDSVFDIGIYETVQYLNELRKKNKNNKITGYFKFFEYQGIKVLIVYKAYNTYIQSLQVKIYLNEILENVIEYGHSPKEMNTIQFLDWLENIISTIQRDIIVATLA